MVAWPQTASIWSILAGCGLSWCARGLDRSRYNVYSRIMEIDVAIQALGALAQGTRLDVFRLLVRHEPAGLPAGEIARRLGVPHTTLSTHLGLLSRAGLVRSTRKSRSIIYRAELEAIRRLVAFLLENCCDGASESCGFGVADLVCCSEVEPAHD